MITIFNILLPCIITKNSVQSWDKMESILYMVKSEGVVGELVIQSIYLTKMRRRVREYG